MHASSSSISRALAAPALTLLTSAAVADPALPPEAAATAPPAPAPRTPAPAALPAPSLAPVAQPAYSPPPPPPSPAAPAPPPEGEPGPRSHHGAELGLELGGAFQAGAHFPENADARSVEEAVDADLGLGLWLIPRSSWAIGLGIERFGLGKDHYGTDTSSQTLNASYVVDTLWLGGRLYFSEDRPAFYLGVAAGPALPRVRATGTRATSDQFTVPPQPFECSETAAIGAALAAAAGVEFDIADAWSLVGEGRVSAQFVPSSAGAFGGCAPGSGSAVGGSLRVGIAWRFGL